MPRWPVFAPPLTSQVAVQQVRDSGTTPRMCEIVATQTQSALSYSTTKKRKGAGRCLMGTARRQFTDEFKGEAVGLLPSSGRPLSQIARELGIAASMLRAWRDAGGRGNTGPPRRSNTQAAARIPARI